MAMAPSATVFPGGNLSEADTALAKTLRHDAANGQDSTEIALKICALRETFEETGILVRRSYQDIDKITKEQYAAARKKVRDDYSWRRRPGSDELAKVYADAAEFLPFYQSTSKDKQESLPLELLS
jgi:8-oxo-dGTP pyrophosphatase MutT (NUDIX family)